MPSFSFRLNSLEYQNLQDKVGLCCNYKINVHSLQVSGTIENVRNVQVNSCLKSTAKTFGPKATYITMDLPTNLFLENYLLYKCYIQCHSPVLSTIKVYKTVSERFVDVFKEQVAQVIISS